MAPIDVSARPFTCAYLPAQDPNETRIEFSFRSLDSGSSKKVASDIAALMTSVAIVGRRGGFSGEQFHPRESSVILNGHRNLAGDQFHWSFAHMNVGDGLILTLENLAHGLHCRNSHLEGVRIWTAFSDQGHGPATREVKVYQPLPYEYKLDVRSPTVVVDVEFVDRQDAERWQPCRDEFDAWYLVAAAAGFSDEEFRPSEEVAIVLENELQITSIGMQVVYGRSRVGRSGFQVLTNMLTSFHYGLGGLALVEIT
ncbi:hypothetical protein [Roseateles sp.]|uniref:hypothetical protein n=1 Tax=Roseateles sp. TaxID=1971397 RepID=UPI0039E88414